MDLRSWPSYGPHVCKVGFLKITVPQKFVMSLDLQVVVFFTLQILSVKDVILFSFK